MALRFHSSSSGFSRPFSASTFFSCDIANAIAALRTMLKPMRATAVRSSVIGLATEIQGGGVGDLQQRAPRAQARSRSTRTTLSGVTLSSASTLRTRIAMSGKLGSSTLPLRQLRGERLHESKRLRIGCRRRNSSTCAAA